jgi:hypothetical protein
MITALPRLMTVLALAATALVACASPRGAAAGSASITAADVDGTPPPAAHDAAPTGEPSASPATSTTSPGQPVCRISDAFGVTSELHLTWDGTAAKGFLRRLAPSGMSEDLPVRAERDGRKIIVDAPNETDLTAHVAVVGEHAGKRLMRVGGEGATWFRCE